MQLSTADLCLFQLAQCSRAGDSGRSQRARQPERCVVIEDAVVGVQAAKAAGMRCLAVATTHAAEKLAEADRVVPDLTHVTVEELTGMLRASS